MAIYYSNKYSSQTSATEKETGHSVGPAGLILDAADAALPSAGAARSYVQIATIAISSDILTAEEIRLCRFKSSDRITDIRVSTVGTSETGAFDIGLHEAGFNDDGAVVTPDVFADAYTLDPARANVSIFKQSTDLTDVDRGKPLWELADASATATYTEDPKELWDLTMTLAGTVATDATADFTFTIEYTSGG